MAADAQPPGGAVGDPPHWEPPWTEEKKQTLLGSEGAPGSGGGPAWRSYLWENICCWRVIGVISIVILIIGILLATSCPHVSRSTASKEMATPKERCPEKWTFYINCFFFNGTLNSYDSAMDFCSLYNASLLEIENESKLIWLQNLSGKKDYWIGLHTKDGVLQWTSGAPYDNTLFQAHSSGDCAYVRNTGIFLSNCTMLRRSICERRPLQ